MTFCVLATPGPDLPTPADSPDKLLGSEIYAIFMLPEFGPKLRVVSSTTECAHGSCPVTLRFIDERLVWIFQKARTPPKA
jgi:hypothetical protein